MTPASNLPIRSLVLLTTATLWLGACGQTSADREVRISTEQSAIQSYSAKIPEAIRYRSAFADQWRIVNEIKDLKAYSDAMQARVVPALEKYVVVLRMMPT